MKNRYFFVLMMLTLMFSLSTRTNADDELRYLLAVGADYGGGIKILDAFTGERVKDFSSLKIGTIRTHCNITISADGKKIGITGDKHDEKDTNGLLDVVSVIDYESGTVVRKFGEYSGDHAALSPDGKTIVSMVGSSGKPKVSVWDIDTGELKKTWYHPGDGMALGKAITFSMNGKNFAAHRDGMIRIWDADRNIVLTTLETGGMGNIKFSPDGQLIGGTTGVWNILTKKQVYSNLEGHGGVINSFAWSPCGKYTATGGYDETLIVRNALDGSILYKQKIPGNYLFALAFSPDSKYIVTGTWNVSNNLNIYEARTGKLINNIPSPDTCINSLCFFPFPPEQMKKIEIQNQVESQLVQSMEYLKINQKRLAETELKEAVKLEGSGGDAEFVLALVEFYGNKNTKTANTEFAKCVKRQPENVAAWNNLAATAMINRNYAEAYRGWKKVQELEPGSEAVVQNLGRVMDRIDKRQITSLTQKQVKQFADLYIEAQKTAKTKYDANRGWQLLPLAGVTDGKEYEAFFTRKTSAGKATGAPYEWK